MKTNILYPVLIAAVIACHPALAEEPTQQREARNQRRQTFEHKRDLGQELGLPPETATKLREAIASTRARLEPLHEQMRAVREEVDKHMRSDVPDETAAIAAIDKMAELHKQVIAMRIANRKLIADLLTPAQLAKFNELRGQMETARHRRMNVRQEAGAPTRHGPPPGPPPPRRTGRAEKAE